VVLGGHGGATRGTIPAIHAMKISDHRIFGGSGKREYSGVLYLKYRVSRENAEV
jgi:hypothetical protein